MAEDIVKLEVSDHIALVTLNRPPVNALNRAMRDAIIAIFDAVSERDDIRVAVLTGAGKTFCAAMAPLAPPRFSTITGWPRCLPSVVLTERAITSDRPPAGYGTTSDTGLVGKACAWTAPVLSLIHI